jgi:ABC-type antimicrobial peptide transport system permease subunit
MFTNYFKIAWRNILKNKTISILNIAGLTTGMAVAMLIGFWIWDELTFDKGNKNYSTIAQVARKEKTNGEIFISEQSNHFPIPLAAELRANYNNYFSQVSLATDKGEQLLSVDDKKFSRMGMYVEPEFTRIFTLNIVEGSPAGFADPYSILISQSLATALFGKNGATGNTVKLSNKQDVKVAGVFSDMPSNDRFSDISFFCPISLLIATNENVKKDQDNWGNSSFLIFVQTVPGVKMTAVSEAIKDVYWPKIESNRPTPADERTTLFVHPMKDWHLRSEWKNGVQTGQIQLVRLFGMIGIFVLLLACVNFMNLSTARSQKRAREVGIRKTFGSLRGQLIRQFLNESLVIVVISFVLSLGIVMLTKDAFNALAGKNINYSFANPVFWVIALIFILITSLLSGSYPAFYLSAFRPAQVLKGTFRAGKAAVVLRRLMSGLQFTVSIVLIIGTIVVYRQVQYAQDRPLGYERDGLIRVSMRTADLNGKYDVLQKELLASGGAIGFAQSSSSTTNNNYFDDRFEWQGKDPKLPKMAFSLTAVTWDFGKTVGWKFLAGRDFSRQFPTDQSAIILNEAAVKYMRLNDPVGQTIRWNGNPYTVVGVIKDMVTESPYKPVQQSAYFMVPGIGPVITIRLNPNLSASQALARIEPVFKNLDPSAPFEYKFVDEEYGRKFAAEKRMGVLSSLFAALAIFISCLGIFGLASFVAQQRIREVSMRKVLGASVINLWGLLTKEFVILVGIAFVIAIPFANYFASQWLQKYEFNAGLAWWIFALAGLIAMVITIVTVSFHAIKAAITNPIKTLRTE